MTRDEKIARARRAAEILEDPLVVEVLAGYTERLLTAWRNTPPVGGTDKREALWYALKAAEGFQADLRAIVDEGKLAEAQIAAERDQDAVTSG